VKQRILVIASLLTCLGSGGAGDQAAEAFPAFKYGGRSTCNVCHLGGAADREHRNDYGQALARLLDRPDAEALSIENQRRNPQAARAAMAKIDDALRAVEESPSGPRPGAPTFGQLIRAGKLPISPTALPPAAVAR
jgi:phage baseplate assembly protein W